MLLRLKNVIREIFTDYLRQVINASADRFHLHLYDHSDCGIKITFSTPTACETSPCYNIFVLTAKFYVIGPACPSIDTFLHEPILHRTEERRTAHTDAINPEAFIELLKHAADSHYRTSGHTNLTPMTSNTSIMDPKTWFPKIWKLAISLFLPCIWGCVMIVRAIFQLQMTGGGPGSSIGGSTKKQMDYQSLHCDPFKHLKASKIQDASWISTPSKTAVSGKP